MLTITRGDTKTLTVTLYTPDGTLGTLNALDVLRFTAKRSRHDSDRHAIIRKTSLANGGITFSAGQSTATVTILPADYPHSGGDIRFSWDVQIAFAGDATNVKTLASGTGEIIDDVTDTAP